ncbi:MAG: hypothetical protein Q9190_004621 [Brigantiaea leucoxantha]
MSSYPSGCHFSIGRKTHYLPQIQLEAHSTILSNTSRTILRQTFSNATAKNIEQCIYTFPLYDGVSVVGFVCHVGSRTLHGVVKQRSKAKETYEKAVARGETAGLLEQLLQASDVFSTYLGNIPAQGEVVVEITYIGELKHDAEADGIRFTIPTGIAPRYGSLPNSQLIAGASRKHSVGINITVDASMSAGSFIQGIQSPSHPIAVTMGNTSKSSECVPAMNRASATLTLGTTELDKDFVLVILNKEVGHPKALLETHPDIPDQRAMMLTLVPNFNLSPGHPEILFVADRSGSMEYRIPTLISALKIFLRSLPVGVKFNICSFGSHHSFLWSKSHTYSRDSLHEALAYVDDFRADYGGTETLNAMKAAIGNRYIDLSCEVMLLTDGDIWNQNELFSYLNREVEKSKAGLRVFALGVGNGVSSALIEGVARSGNGFAQTVGDNEKLDNKIIRMLKGALSPHTTDYSLDILYDGIEDEKLETVEATKCLNVALRDKAFDTTMENTQDTKPISFFSPRTADEQPTPIQAPSAGNQTADPYAHLPDISPPKILQTPQNIPSLFPFSRTSIYLLLSPDSVHKTPKSVILRAKSSSGPLELEIPVESMTEPGMTIHQLAARKAIQELEENRGWLFEAKDGDSGVLIKDRCPGRFDEIIEREAVRLGVQFQVGGRWCSFVAVSENGGESTGQEPRASELDGQHLSSLARVDSWDHVKAMVDMGDDDSDETMGCGLFDEPDDSQPATLGLRRGGRVGLVRHSLGYHCVSAPLDVSRRGVDNDTSQALRGSRSGPFYYSGNRSERSAPEKKQQKWQTASEKVHAVIELHDFDGWWEYDQRLCRILGVELGRPRSRVWMTLLVVMWFEMRMGAENEVWEFVVQKARAWLAGRKVEVWMEEEVKEVLEGILESEGRE